MKSVLLLAERFLLQAGAQAAWEADGAAGWPQRCQVPRVSPASTRAPSATFRDQIPNQKRVKAVAKRLLFSLFFFQYTQTSCDQQWHFRRERRAGGGTCGAGVHWHTARSVPRGAHLAPAPLQPTRGYCETSYLLLTLCTGRKSKVTVKISGLTQLDLMCAWTETSYVWSEQIQSLASAACLMGGSVLET